METTSFETFFKVGRYNDDTSFQLIVSPGTQRRIASCFTTEEKPGTFAFFENIKDLFEDPDVWDAFCDDIKKIIEEDREEGYDKSPWDFTIDCKKLIGWPKFVPKKYLPNNTKYTRVSIEDSLSVFQVINEKIKVPPTYNITFFIKTNHRDNLRHSVIYLQDVYPGREKIKTDANSIPPKQAVFFKENASVQKF